MNTDDQPEISTIGSVKQFFALAEVVEEAIAEEVLHAKVSGASLDGGYRVAVADGRLVVVGPKGQTVINVDKGWAERQLADLVGTKVALA